jgi:hypothetical protein
MKINDPAKLWKTVKSVISTNTKNTGNIGCLESGPNIVGKSREIAQGFAKKYHIQR